MRWASCNIFSTKTTLPLPLPPRALPVFAVKGETLVDYWDYTHRILTLVLQAPKAKAQPDSGRRR